MFHGRDRSRVEGFGNVFAGTQIVDPTAAAVERRMALTPDAFNIILQGVGRDAYDLLLTSKWHERIVRGLLLQEMARDAGVNITDAQRAGWKYESLASRRIGEWAGSLQGNSIHADFTDLEDMINAIKEVAAFLERYPSKGAWQARSRE